MARSSFSNRSLAIIATILCIGAAKIGFPVLMPVAVAVFVIATAWPVRDWLDTRLPRALSYVGTIAVLFCLIGGFFVLVGYAFDRVLQTFLDNQERIRALYNSYEMVARRLGLPAPLDGAGDGVSNFDRLIGVGRMLVSDIYAAASYTGLVAVIVILGFAEVPAWRRVSERNSGMTGTGAPRG